MNDIHVTNIQKIRTIDAPEPPEPGVMAGTAGDFFTKLRVNLAALLALDDAAFEAATSGPKWQAIMENE
jgi:hypothetical protein